MSVAAGGRTGLLRAAGDNEDEGLAARMVVATLAMLLVAFAIQTVFTLGDVHTSLSDLPRVFAHRGIGRSAVPYLDRVVEYPIGAGLLLYVAALVWPSPIGVLVVTALGATGVCVAITVVLCRRFGRRAWRWALASPVFLFAFQNWDMFAIGALLIGLLAFERRRDGVAGAAFGTGAAIKLFPAVVVVPLAALRWSQGERRDAFRLVGYAAATLLVFNVPFWIANRSAWWWPLHFQGERNATWGSAWYYLLRIAGAPVHGLTGARLANLVSLAALAATLTWLVVVTVRRRLAPFAAAAASVALFLLCNKVYSPTYDVWLVVFFVLLPLSRRLWITFCLVDAAIYITVYGHFHSLTTTQFVHLVLPALVALRTLVLFLIVRATTSTHIGTPRLEPQATHTAQSS